MAKVYTTTPGVEARIGIFGVATNDTPAIVPDEVADELELDMKGEKPVEADPKRGIEGTPGRSALGPIYRIERDAQPGVSRAVRTAPALSGGELKDAQKGKGE